MNPRRPTPADLKSPALCQRNTSITRRVENSLQRFPQDVGSHDMLSAVKPPSPQELEEFYEWCLRETSRETCDYYKRYLLKSFNPDNRWSSAAYKKYYRWLCEEKGRECDTYKRLKVKKSKVDLYVPSLEDILASLRLAEAPYSSIYYIMLQSGLRLEEACYLASNIDKLRKTKLDGFYRVELGLERGMKRAWVAYLVELPRKLNVSADQVSSYARRNNLVRPKYLRKFVSTQMAKLGIPEAVIEFITGKKASTILRKHYLQLLSLADQYYPKYAEWLKENILKVFQGEK